MIGKTPMEELEWSVIYAHMSGVEAGRTLEALTKLMEHPVGRNAKDDASFADQAVSVCRKLLRQLETVRFAKREVEAGFEELRK